MLQFLHFQILDVLPGPVSVTYLHEDFPEFHSSKLSFPLVSDHNSLAVFLFEYLLLSFKNWLFVFYSLLTWASFPVPKTFLDFPYHLPPWKPK